MDGTAVWSIVVVNIPCQSMGDYVYKRLKSEEGKMKEAFVMLMMTMILGFIQQAYCAEAVLNPADVPRMTKEQLRAKMNNPDLVIIDVRSDHDWQDSQVKIKGSVREDPQKPDSWIDKYPKDKMIVLYCK